MSIRRLLIAALLIAALSPAEVAFGCFCRIPSFPEARDAAAVVFSGRAILTDPVLQFEVLRVYKGSLGKVVEITNATDDCAYLFEFGREYLVFAKAEDSRLMTRDCMRNRPLESAEDLSLLGPGWRPSRRAPKRGRPRKATLRPPRAAELAHAAERAQ
jgi:hypothetical protein